MTATIDRQGQIILNVKAKEKLRLRSGDVLVVNHAVGGQIVLKKRPPLVESRSRKNYLNPPPLPTGVLEQIYESANSEWEKLEREATVINRRSLAGKRVDDL